MLRACQRFGKLALIASVCLTGTTAIAQDEPEHPVPAPEPGESLEHLAVPGAPYAVAAAPTVYPAPHVIGEYRVGHIHKPWLAHIFQYSTYNPYVDLIHQPYRQTIYGNRHARYYTTYRSLMTPQWGAMYFPAASYCPPGEAQPAANVDPNARAPYGPGSATYFGAY